jgi:hypothetical protein
MRHDKTLAGHGFELLWGLTGFFASRCLQTVRRLVPGAGCLSDLA